MILLILLLFFSPYIETDFIRGSHEPRSLKDMQKFQQYRNNHDTGYDQNTGNDRVPGIYQETNNDQDAPSKESGFIRGSHKPKTYREMQTYQEISNDQDTENGQNTGNAKLAGINQNTNNAQGVVNDQNAENNQDVVNDPNAGQDKVAGNYQDTGNAQDVGKYQDAENNQDMVNDQNTGHDKAAGTYQDAGNNQEPINDQDAGNDQDPWNVHNVGNDQDTYSDDIGKENDDPNNFYKNQMQKLMTDFTNENNFSKAFHEKRDALRQRKMHIKSYGLVISKHKKSENRDILYEHLVDVKRVPPTTTPRPTNSCTEIVDRCSLHCHEQLKWCQMLMYRYAI